MRTYRGSNYTLNSNSRKASRPNSATKRQLNIFKINTSSDVPPPIIFTMPNNPKKLSGMGNKIEREQLYENNMQLKELINKLKKELAETKNQVVKKDIEIRKKERIIKECSKENDLESVHELNLEKARESTLVSLCKDKYNELKIDYMKKCEENEILKANIKITKLKEYKIQIDVLKAEMEKIRTLYLHTLEDNTKLNQDIKEYQTLRNKYIEQHNLINNFIKKSNQYNNDINELKEENDFLKLKLEQYARQQKALKSDNVKLKISNKKYLINKKNKENYTLTIDDNRKLISSLRKDLNEYKRLYGLKNIEYNELIENTKKAKAESKKINVKEAIKPFDFNLVKVIENKKEDKETNKLSLYKSLLDESRHKIEIYELYLKKIGVDKEQLIKSFGYEGVMTTSTKIKDKDSNNNDNNSSHNNNNHNYNNDNNNSDNNNNDNNKDDNNNDNNTNFENNNNLASIETNNNLESIKQNTQNNVTNNNINSENNEEINKEESIKNINNINNINSISSTNEVTNSNNFNNNAKENTNTVSSNFQKLPSIEEEKQEDATYSDENQLLSLLHVFVKNLEANNITKEQITQKIEEISKLFENKEEATKEEFIEPFLKMFIETMKITQEKDIEIINNFLSDFVDSLNGETVVFFNGLLEVFDNIKDFRGINKDNEVSFELNKYKEQLINMLKQNDVNNNHLITFDIFRKIVQDLNIILDDESMEYLIYLMKKNVPENNSIFDLNYEIIEKLMEKNEIGDIFANIKNILANNKTNIDNECQEFLTSAEYQDIRFLIIKKDDFFSKVERLGVSISDELQNSIYELFKVEFENEANQPQYWMEYDKIKSELE